MISMLVVWVSVSVLFSSIYQDDTDGEERAVCLAWFVFLVSRDCCVALPRGDMGLSAVCECGIS